MLHFISWSFKLGASRVENNNGRNACFCCPENPRNDQVRGELVKDVSWHSAIIERLLDGKNCCILLSKGTIAFSKVDNSWTIQIRSNTTMTRLRLQGRNIPRV